MTVLALDSSTPSAAVALWRDGELLASDRAAAGNTHSACLLPMIEHILSVCSLTVGDVDLFACGVGPGSFTGVRIAVSTAKGLAAPLEKPCVALSSLEACASALSYADGTVVPVFNARRGNVYAAVFSAKDGALCRICDDMIISVAGLCDTLVSRGTGKVYFAGDAARDVFAAAKDAGINAAPVSPSASVTDAAGMCALAARIYEAAGEEKRRGFTADALSPVYLRPGRAAGAALPE